MTQAYAIYILCATMRLYPDAEEKSSSELAPNNTGEIMDMAILFGARHKANGVMRMPDNSELAHINNNTWLIDDQEYTMPQRASDSPQEPQEPHPTLTSQEPPAPTDPDADAGAKFNLNL